MAEMENIEAEQQLIGTLLIENKLFDAVADLIEPDDFALPFHGRLYEAGLVEVMAGKPASPVTIRPLIEADPDLASAGGMAYVFQLTAHAGLADVRDLAKHIRDLSLRRFMQSGLRAAADMCADMQMKPMQIIDAADHALAIHTNDNVHQPTGADCIDEMLASYADKSLGVSCGQIPALDELLGPLRPKQLVIGAGRPGMGKTAVALSYALGAAAMGHGVLFVSLEMGSTELAQRMASDLCFGSKSIPFAAIRDGAGLSSFQMNQLGDARNHLRKLPFQVIDAGSLTMGRLNMLVRRHARRMLAKGHKLELVVIDYLQLMRADGNRRSNYEEVSEVSRGLKNMAKDHGLAVLALAQLSREVEKRPDKRPQLSDLRDSGQIEQDADTVLFLLRQEYYLHADEPLPTDKRRAEWEDAMQQFQGQIEFIVAKRRQGTTGNAIGAFHGAYQAVR